MTERFICPVCGTASSHPEDLANGYCGRCRAFTAGESPMPILTDWLADKPCPECGRTTLRVVTRETYQAKDLGTFSLAGVQPKVSAHRFLWPWVMCSNTACSFEKRVKRVDE